MERYLNLSVGLSAASRKRKILELIQQALGWGLIEVTLHEADEGGDNFKSTDPNWQYDNETTKQQIETIVDSIDRHIADAYERGDRRYGGATVTVFDRRHPIACYG
jgi:hypothetical protein